MPIQPIRPRTILFILALFAVIHLVAQSASAMPIEIRELTIKAVVQKVDTNGDGRLDDFAANYTVYPDGRATGTIQLDRDCVIDIEQGTLAQDDSGLIQVSLDGKCERGHEIGHIYTVRHEVTPNTSNSMGGDDPLDPIRDLIFFDVVDMNTGQTNSFAAEVQVNIR